MKKRLLSFVPFLLASLASAQEPTTGPAATTQTAAEARPERQFVGEVVAVDVEGKTLTVKASQPDAKGERIEKTMTLPVEENAFAQLQSLGAGDKVTVLWRKDEASQRDTVVKLVKRDAAASEKP